MENNNGFKQYDNSDNKVWSAFTLNQFPTINWKMEATSNDDDFCSVDQLVTGTTNSGKKETYNIELKCREFAPISDKYIKDCFLECDKYEGFKKFENNKNLYVAIYPYVKTGGLIYIWDLNNFTNEELEGIKQYKLMNRTTAEKSNKVWKWVYLLPTDKAIMYKFESIQYYK